MADKAARSCIVAQHPQQGTPTASVVEKRQSPGKKNSKNKDEIKEKFHRLLNNRLLNWAKRAWAYIASLGRSRKQALLQEPAWRKLSAQVCQIYGHDAHRDDAIDGVLREQQENAPQIWDSRTAEL